jgi:hypothetical protein
MDATQEPLANDNDIYLNHQLNVQDLSFLYLDPAYRFASAGSVIPTRLIIN